MTDADGDDKQDKGHGESDQHDSGVRQIPGRCLMFAITLQQPLPLLVMTDEFRNDDTVEHCYDQRGNDRVDQGADDYQHFRVREIFGNGRLIWYADSINQPVRDESPSKVIGADEEVDEADANDSVSFSVDRGCFHREPHRDKAFKADKYHQPRRRHFSSAPSPEEEFTADEGQRTWIQRKQPEKEALVEGTHNDESGVRQ